MLEKFNELRDLHPELGEAPKAGKEFVDASLERALAERAAGHPYIKEEIMCSREGDIRVERLRSHLPSDEKALELWLRAHPRSS